MCSRLDTTGEARTAHQLGTSTPAERHGVYETPVYTVLEDKQSLVASIHRAPSVCYSQRDFRIKFSHNHNETQKHKSDAADGALDLVIETATSARAVAAVLTGLKHDGRSGEEEEEEEEGLDLRLETRKRVQTNEAKSKPGGGGGGGGALFAIRNTQGG